LATGVDGEKRDFRSVYKILEKFYYRQALTAGKDKETALQ